MLKDIIDGLKLVSDGISSVKSIAKAIKTGKDYVSSKHPEIRDDLRLMLVEQLNRTSTQKLNRTAL